MPPRWRKPPLTSSPLPLRSQRPNWSPSRSNLSRSASRRTLQALAEGEKVKITIVDSDGVTVLNEFEIAKGEAVTDIGYVKEGYVLQGVYVTPALLGGQGLALMPSIVVQQLTGSFAWPFGAALAVVMAASTLVIVSAFTLATQRLAERTRA